MKINKEVKLLLRDVYLYDIVACHYTIMKKLGLDVSNINFENKLERNTQIGKMMRKNPQLTSTLRSTTKSIIDEYISRNNIKKEEIILRQYDGIIITKILKENNINHIPLALQKQFQIFISSIDRKKYIAYDSQYNISIKGVSYRYKEMDKIYLQLCKLNYANKSSIFRNLQRIKDKFMESKDVKLFAIPTDDGKFTIFLNGYGELKTTSQTLHILDPQDIDRDKYFKFYIEPFTKSITIEFLK